MANGGHVSRSNGKGRTPLALRKGNAAQPPFVRKDTATPPVGGETSAALKEALERGDRR
jgi:hypothetical protein